VCSVSPRICPLAQAAHDRALAGRARRLIDDGQHVADELTLGFAVFPPGQAFGDRVHVIDAPFGISGDDGIADRLQGDLGALLRLENRGFSAFLRSVISVNRALGPFPGDLFLVQKGNDQQKDAENKKGNDAIEAVEIGNVIEKDFRDGEAEQDECLPAK